MASDPAPKIALALEDDALRARIAALLKRAGIETVSLRTGETGWWEEAAASDAAVVVVRGRQFADSSSPDAIEMAKQDEGPEVVVVSGNDDAVTRAGYMSAGAAGVLDADASNLDLQAALSTVTDALAERGAAQPDLAGQRAEPRLADFLSRSPRMKSFLEVVERIKTSDSSLLIVGETGVGKEHLARAIHAESTRASGPFVGVNCGAIPEHLLESELFGHERGAFTGATGKRVGRFREGEGGTVFLDEIGDLPKHLQVSLLTVLQRREVRPLGADATVPVDVRLMAASNRDLAEDVAEGRFREDLYYRLNVVRLEIPPLRERREDIPELVGTFMRHLRPGLEREDVTGISPAAMRALLDYEWPGNIRELINVVERAMLLCRGESISEADLPEPMGTLPAPSASGDSLSLPEAWDERPFQEVKKELVARFERKYLSSLLERTGGRVGESARLAGIAERTLYEKMRRLGVHKEDFRESGTDRA